MNLILNILLPIIEKELQNLEPQLAALALKELQMLGDKIVKWAENKLKLDINKDGKIG